MILLNGKPVPTTIFPDHTSQVWKLNQEILETTNFAHVTWEFQHEGEFMQLAQLSSLLERHRFRTCLRLPYLPYGRQDKLVGNDATFALHTFANLLNSLHFDEIICMDPHSPIAGHLIRNFRAVYPLGELEAVMGETVTTRVCYPDAGALKKYSTIYKSVVGDEFMYGEKVRDQATGFITSYDLYRRASLKSENVLIVDDICDGGATFTILAKKLQEVGAKEINLFVTHGIFSRGLKPLFASGIKRVFTKDGEATMVQDHLAYRK